MKIFKDPPRFSPGGGGDGGTLDSCLGVGVPLRV